MTATIRSVVRSIFLCSLVLGSFFETWARDDVSVDSAQQISDWAPANFTDPRDHDPQKFRYIVHAFDKPRLLHNPDYLNQVLSFSASVIDEHHTATYDNAGVILRVPAKNIIAVSQIDMGSGGINSRSATELQTLKKDPRFPYYAPEKFLRYSEYQSNGTHNEIIVTGLGGSSEPVQIVGVFHKGNKGISRAPKSLVTELRRFSQKQKIPLVMIEEVKSRLAPKDLVLPPVWTDQLEKDEAPPTQNRSH